MIGQRHQRPALTEAHKAVLRAWNYNPTTPVRSFIAMSYWLGSISYIPTREDLQRRFHLSRASGYRWHAFAVQAGAARGLQQPD